MKRTLLNIIILLISIWSYGQSCGALMIPMSIEDRVNESTKIVEGLITDSQSYWDVNKHHIYTVHTVNVYTDILGKSASAIKVVTMGGIVGDTMQVISDAAIFNNGDAGIFFLQPFKGKIISKDTLYELVGAAQGAIKYDRYSENASDIFNKYPSITGDLYPKIQKITKQAFTTLEKRPVVSKMSKGILATPVISGFSPTSASAGTQTILTINGSNFGTNMGAVSFPNATSGGSSYTDALDSQIISWSDSQIQVEIPWQAGTGTIRVINSSAESGTSTSVLTIPYSVINPSTSTAEYLSTLPDDNGNGGFTFLYHTEFDSSPGKTYFEEAFELWNCESNINFVFGGTTTIDASIDDDVNVVRFDNGNELPSSTLGRVSATYIGLCGTKGIVKQMDITWNDGANWYYGNGTPSLTQHDFKTVALHELGHAHQLGHVINSNVVMHYAISTGQSKYSLNQNDIDGAVYTMDIFTEDPGCGSTAMSPQYNCCDAIVVTDQPQNENVAENGSATFTVVATNNTTVQWQVTTNSGTSWSDISNNATYSGATGMTLSINDASLSFNGYQYRAYLNNLCDEGVLSNTATLNVIEYTSIPDSNFETALSSYDDITGDNQVPTNNINSITDLNVNNVNISNLTGISAFTALEVLSLNDNSVTSLDLTGISNLRVLAARNNGLTSLDVSTHPNMDVMLLENNSLTSLDVSNNTKLTRIWAQNNNINALDVSNSPLLRAIGITDSNLTSLDLSQNIALEQLYAGGNAITDLDLSNNTALTIVGVNDNNLWSLTVKNGNNTNINTFNATGNPNLFCVLVDDATYSTTNWTCIDAQTSFNDADCTIQYTTIPDPNFEAALSAYDNIAEDGQVPTALIETITTLNVSNKNISDITGIEDFTALDTFFVNQNNLTSLDLSNNNALKAIGAVGNSISTLNLGSNTAYEIISLIDNNLTTIDVSGLTNLEYLLLNENPVESLDLSNAPVLRLFECVSCNLSSLNLQNGNNPNITNFDVTNNPNLTCMRVDDAAYSTANWTDVDAQTTFSDTYCRYTAIPDPNFEAALSAYDNIAGDNQVPTVLIETVTSLNVSNKNISDVTGIEDFTSLDTFFVNQNNLTSLDLSNNNALIALGAVGNNISTLNLGTNSNYEIISLTDNNLTTIDVSGFSNLDYLILSENPIESLDLSTVPALELFRCISCNLSDLNLQNGANTNIRTFEVANNPNLTCVLVDDVTYSTTNWTDIDAQTSFSDTYCRYTAIPDDNFEAALYALGYDDILGDGQVPTQRISSITSLVIGEDNIQDITGIEDFVALNKLELYQVGLSEIDLSNNTLIQNLRLAENPLTVLDVTVLPELKELFLTGTNIATIDFSKNSQLLDINIANSSSLVTVNLRNGNNTAITAFDATSSPNLTCIIVDDASNVPMVIGTNVDAQTNFSDTYCRYTAIPDSKFEAALGALMYDDITSDGQVPTALIEVVTTLSVDRRDIVDLTGIEAFTALEELNCSENLLSTLDLSQNLALREVDLSSNNLANITISDNTKLERLDCSSNNIENLHVSNNVLLEELQADNNSLTAIDVKNLKALKILVLDDNDFSDLDLNANQNLIVLSLNNSFFTALDVSNNALLEKLSLEDCSTLETITFGAIEELIDLSVTGTQIQSLDLSQFGFLTEVNVSQNNLSYLNMKTGTSGFINNFNALDNPNLSCILVDFESISNNWTDGVDDGVVFSETYCRYTSIPDSNFEAALGALMYDDIADDGQVPTALIEGVTSLNIQNSSISDLTGIKDFTALRSLNVSSNSMTSIDISGLTNLETFIAEPASSDLSSIDVTNLPSLKSFTLEFSSVIGLDLSESTALQNLHLYGNNIQSINISNNVALTNVLISYEEDLQSLNTENLVALKDFYVANNALQSLDLSTNTALEKVTVLGNALTYLNLKNGSNTAISLFSATNNPDLTCILVDDAAYSTTNWTNIDNQTSFSDTSCITTLPVSVKVFLQGAAINPNSGEESLMRDDLRTAGLLPTVSPYSDSLTCDATVFTATGNNAIVDWVWVELRDQQDTSVVIAGQSALLQRDGDIVAVDGLSDVEFSESADNYYALVTHRNHLGVLSANTIALSTTVTSLDFTNDTSLIQGGTNAVVDMGSGSYAVLAGDQDGNGQVQNTDINSVITILGGSGYSDADMDMNGQIQNTDINNLMNPNVGKGEQF